MVFAFRCSFSGCLGLFRSGLCLWLSLSVLGWLRRRMLALGFASLLQSGFFLNCFSSVSVTVPVGLGWSRAVHARGCLKRLCYACLCSCLWVVVFVLVCAFCRCRLRLVMGSV